MGCLSNEPRDLAKQADTLRRACSKPAHLIDAKQLLGLTRAFEWIILGPAIGLSDAAPAHELGEEVQQMNPTHSISQMDLWNYFPRRLQPQSPKKPQEASNISDEIHGAILR
ncbi:hypothetical protein HAX54_038929 [Datura stramonium]|uniref:Uncharacterized protein n=1 Tax=Datura stramonium TaxID=4076 RepID=A0ABS8SIW3_DATST|nr:hypothetical protein [Datura stramonium]